MFQVVNTGLRNVIFIKSDAIDVLNLFNMIVEDLNQMRNQKTRYLLRMLPVQITCKAYLEDVASKADTLLDKFFSQEPKTFSIVFK